LIQSSTGDDGLNVKIADIRIFELPSGSQIESDFTNLTADQLAVKYPFFSGTASVQTPLRLRIAGKNSLDYLDVLAQNSMISYGTYNGRRTINFACGSTAQNIRINEGKFAPNTQYTISGDYIVSTSSTSMGFVYTDGTTKVINFAVSGASWTAFSATSDAGKTVDYIKGYYIDSGRTLYLDIDTLQLEPGSTATTYEAYVKTDLYIPDAGELRSVPNAAADSIEPDGAGGYNKVQRVQKYTLQASDIVGSETAGLADVFYTTTTILSGAITLTLSPSGLLTIGTMNQVDYYSRSDIASIG
jgi:hypothetical protein